MKRIGRREKALYREGSKWNDLTQRFDGGGRQQLPKLADWKTMSFRGQCRFVSNLINTGWSKHRLAGFMKKTLKAGEGEWMKCVDALDENCNYVEGT